VTVCHRLSHGLVKSGFAGGVDAVGKVGEYAFGGHAEGGGDQFGVESSIVAVWSQLWTRSRPGDNVRDHWEIDNSSWWESAMAGKFEVYEDSAGKFRFRLKATNGQIVASGQGYESKASAVKGCEAVQRAADGAKIEEVAS